MLGIGITELLLILIAALVFIGPDKLPEIARTLGKIFADFKRIADGLKKDITEPMREPEKSGPRDAIGSSEAVRPDRNE